MLDILQLEKYTNRKIGLNNEIELDIMNNKDYLEDIITNLLKRGIEYGVKSLDLNENSEGLINSIKQIVNSKDLKNIVKSSVDVSLSQALENKKGNLNMLKELNQFKDISLKGGLRFLLSAGVEILFNKVTKLNLFKPVIENLVKNVKSFVMSNSFLQKLNNSIKKIINKSIEFKEMCEKWYKAYEDFDIDSINLIAKELELKKDTVLKSTDCLKENNIIQNMTRLINTKKDKLSQLQLQICNDL